MKTELTEWHFPFLPEGKEIDFDGIEARYAFVQPMKACIQEPMFHYEGDVWTHTKMVMQEMVNDSGWESLSTRTKSVLFGAALLHDIAKPTTKIIENKAIRHPKHSNKGAIMARRLMWDTFDPDFILVPWDIREEICNIIFNHITPFFLIDKSDPLHSIYAMSYTLTNSILARLCKADMAGRIIQNHKDEIVHEKDGVAAMDLYESYCKENNCWSQKGTFANDASRFRYFFERKGDPSFEVYDDTIATAVIMVGIQGAGKSTAAREYGWPIVSVDGTREEMGLHYGANEGKVSNLTKENCRKLMRNKESFVFDATNVFKGLRGKWIRLFHQYKYRIKIHYIENEFEQTLKNNRSRKIIIPDNIIREKMEKVDIPTLMECHEIQFDLPDKI